MALKNKVNEIYVLCLICIFSFVLFVENAEPLEPCKDGENCTTQLKLGEYNAPFQVLMLYIYNTTDKDCLQKELEIAFKGEVDFMDRIIKNCGFDIKIQEPTIGNIKAVTTKLNGNGEVEVIFAFEATSIIMEDMYISDTIEKAIIPTYTDISSGRFRTICANPISARLLDIDSVCGPGYTFKEEYEHSKCLLNPTVV